tara:strand:+ start:2494 stop:3006 length:513 start_codon:yes stop_codon:yes gene_type:complete
MNLIQQRPKPTSFKPPTSPQAFVVGTNIPIEPGQGEFEAQRKFNLKKKGIFGDGVDEMFLTIDAFRLGGYDEEERNTLTKTLQNLILQGKINRRAADYFTDLFRTFPNEGETTREAIAREAGKAGNPYYYGITQRLGNIARMTNQSTLQPPIGSSTPFSPTRASERPTRT